MKNKKLSELMSYAGRHKYLTYSSLVLSVISAVLALFPFVFIFMDAIGIGMTARSFIFQKQIQSFGSKNLNGMSKTIKNIIISLNPLAGKFSWCGNVK